MRNYFTATNRYTAVVLALAVALLLTLSACGGDAAPAAAVPTTAPAAAAPTTAPAGDTAPADTAQATEIKATLSEWALELSQKEVAAGKVTFVVTNNGRMPHNLSVTDSTGAKGTTRTFTASDGAQSLELTLAPGTYTVICALPGHADRGQKTVLVVK
jgi:plastocyanin